MHYNVLICSLNIRFENPNDYLKIEMMYSDMNHNPHTHTHTFKCQIGFMLNWGLTDLGLKGFRTSEIYSGIFLHISWCLQFTQQQS